jgi:hypothetical protein
MDRRMNVAGFPWHSRRFICVGGHDDIGSRKPLLTLRNTSRCSAAWREVRATCGTLDSS